MAITPGRVALVGRRADAWRAALPPELGRLLGVDPSSADLLVVDGSDPGTMPWPTDAALVVVVDAGAPAEPPPSSGALWVVDSLPTAWLPDVLAAVDAGMLLDEAMVRLAGARLVEPGGRGGATAGLEEAAPPRARAAPPAPRPPAAAAPPRSPAVAPPARPPAAAAPPRRHRPRGGVPRGAPLGRGLRDRLAEVGGRLRDVVRGDREGPEAAPTPPGRRLVADFFQGEQVLRRSLPPDADVVLTLHVGVPGPDQPAGAAVVDVPTEPGRESVVLDVTVAGAWPAPLTQQVSVPTGDAAADSTRAAFPLRTPAEGAVVDLQVTLSYRGRPLQVGSVAAPVRSTPVPGDRVSVTTRNTSSGPLPAATLLAAPPVTAVTIDARGADLVNVRTGDLVPQTDVADVLAGLGLALSRVLGTPFAPTGFADEAARSLVVDLARRGSLLRDKLAPLGIGEAREVNLLVLAHGTLFPFELLYDGPRPERGAKVCDHGPAAACPGPSVRRACPFAFWGASRTICRTVQLDRWTSEPLERVLLAPTLVAAAARADAGGTPPLPSAQLLDDLGRTLASAPARATSWSGWRRAVRSTTPGLLVLLAHTEDVPGDHLLEIGRHSQLALADVRRRDLVGPAGVAPLVVLIACATAQAQDPYGSFHGALVDAGAAAVVGTLGKLNGPQGARAASAIVAALRAAAGTPGEGTLGAALTRARRDLLGQGLLVGLLLVSHGEIAATVVP